MDGYLSNKPDNFVDDPNKLYRLRRRQAHQAKKLDFVDSESEDKGSKDWGAMHPGHHRPTNLEP
jgi:hypothetical protein